MSRDEVGTIPAGMKRFVFGALFGLILLFGACSTAYTVNSGERAVILTWGEANPVAVTEGLHFKAPIAQTVIKMSVRTEKYEADAAAASKDLQSVRAKIAVNFHLNQENVVSVYRDLGLGYHDSIIQPAVLEAVKAVTAQYTAEQLITQRAQVSTAIEDTLRENLASRNIIVEGISITDFDFSDGFNQAIEAKVTAEQLQFKAKNDLERIKIEAAQQIAQAEGQKQAAIALAQAEAEKVRIVTEELQRSPEFVNYIRAQKWDGKLPLIVGSATPLIGMQIDDLTGGNS